MSDYLGSCQSETGRMVNDEAFMWKCTCTFRVNMGRLEGGALNNSLRRAFGIDLLQYIGVSWLFQKQTTPNKIYP